jgi:hypothetical protein
MPIQNINIGTAANDGTGDTLRAAGAKINANFAELVSSVSGIALASLLPDVTALPPEDLDGTVKVLVSTQAGEPFTLSLEDLRTFLDIPVPPPGPSMDGTFVQDGIVYGNRIGPKGPKQVLFAIWNQADVGYCFETNNVAEDLFARWKLRGINTVKPGHPDITLEGRAQQLLASAKAQGMMLIAMPRWEPELGSRSNTAALDFRSLALTDPYWRTNWIGYQVIDEMDLQPYPLSVHVGHIANMVLDGVSKPVFANFTRRAAVPAAAGGTQTINWHAAYNVPQIKSLSIDSYEWHLTANQSNAPIGNKTTPDTWVSTWNGEGIYNTALSAPLDVATRLMFGRRFAASVTGLAVHLQRIGPLTRGRSTDGGITILPPDATTGDFVLPSAMVYAPGDKSTGHYVATGRVEISSPSYPKSGRWQPGRFLRSESWSGFVHGSSALYLFPQTPGTAVAQGYIDATNNTVVITSEPANPFLFGGAVRIQTAGDFTLKGWVRRDNHQISGTPGGAGVYALDVDKAAPVATGSAGAPVQLQFSTEARPWGDDTNLENLEELKTVIANINRMQSHPTGGDLMIDTVQGGRRSFTVMRCPDINGDASLYREDMTLAPIQAGYTPSGEPILDSGGGAPLWLFGWPMGFEGFSIVGDDAATYSYVRSMSNGNRPTWFPGYAPLGLPARFFGPYEVVGFRRVAPATASEMVGGSGILKAGVDDGAASWFFLESTPVVLPEGNGGGTTAFTITINRGGSANSSQSVTATVSAAGIAPASAADFQGGVFPSQTITFAQGETSKSFVVNVNADAAAEQDETFLVALSNPTGGAQIAGSGRGSMLCTITNDDAPVVGAVVWLVSTLDGPPSLTGAPSGAVHLKATETGNVNRGGITMRSVSNGLPTNDGNGFAGVPQWQIGNNFQGVRFTLPAGQWEFAPIASSASWGGGVSGTVTIKDDPDGLNTTRQALLFTGTGGLLATHNGTTTEGYTTSSTAVAEVFNNLRFVPVTVTDLGSGTGVVQVYADGTNVSAIALRQVA